MHLQHDFKFNIATGKSRREIAWKNKTIFWSTLVEKISVTHRTAETYAEYLGAKKERQSEIKDIGGFVGGYLSGGGAKPAAYRSGWLITLDIDHGSAALWDDFTLLYDNAAALYSTHKHSPETPRFRLVIPLDKPVSADQYEAIARRIAYNLGIDAFDDTTFESTRLMYWPSTAKDGEYVFHYQDGEPLSAEMCLSAYRNWNDVSEWPMSSRQSERMRIGAKKQGDPWEKPGIVGAFCRTYGIVDVIGEYLSEEYESTDQEDRYTFTGGSTAAGLIVYEDKYAFSHHGTDPASGKLCNSFDLVRLHKFGTQDENCTPDTPINRRPSYLTMEDLARRDKGVSLLISRERLELAQEDFAVDPATEDMEGTAPASDEWLSQLEKDKKGNTLSTLGNIILILENDPKLKQVFAFDEFAQREIITRSLPWRPIKTSRFVTERDGANLAHRLEKLYGLPLNLTKQDTALAHVFEKYKVHPVREYLSGLTWDGTARADTLFIDYLGAEDTPYTRAVTRKILTAAVARVFVPGIKFDYAPVLVGQQGVGKSTIIQRLGREWFSDTFTTVEGKEAFEQLQGVWIIEMGELAGLKKAEVGTVKHFISKTADRFRAAYGKKVMDCPRQCVFLGTTNDGEFLRNDANGNRKFWPISVYVSAPVKDLFEDLTEPEVGQIWAEAVHLFRAGESLHLSADLEAEANAIQADHTEKDERTGQITEFLDMLLPASWESWDIDQRRGYLMGGELQEVGTIQRVAVCAGEIWCELFGKRPGEMTAYNTKDIHTILRGLPGWERATGGRRFKYYGYQKWYRRTG
ncbi:VapE domain-containing protein [Puia sp. P3]|uniref:VapE domain-containing protein n=1 Tax=Puia sp. P3 TaxID=3423952 RepID=UPI003D67C82B